MFKVILYYWIFYILLWGKIIIIFLSTKICISPRSHYKKSKTWACGYMQVQLPSCFDFHALNLSFHTKSTFEKGDLAKFGFQWIGAMEFAPYFELPKKWPCSSKSLLQNKSSYCSCNVWHNQTTLPTFLHNLLWKPMEYSHMFTNHNI